MAGSITKRVSQTKAKNVRAMVLIPTLPTTSPSSAMSPNSADHKYSGFLFFLTPVRTFDIKLAANTGLITNATNSEAAKVMISVAGRYFMNEPVTPGQNNSGKNGANVVSIPAKTGRKTSAGAYLAA